jgi:ubiquinone biosynthesis accessory factor UbiJ
VLSALDIVNRALEREPWARAKLAEHEGHTVRVQIGPASQAFVIDGDGRLLDSATTPDLRLSIAPLQLPALLSQPERWGDLVVAEGDTALAATLRELAQTLPWFVEGLFARLFGPVAGQKLADLGRRLMAFPGYAAQRFGDSFANYVGDEAPVAVSAADAGVFASEIAALAAGVDALTRRIDGLELSATRTASGSPSSRGAAGTGQRPS